VIDSSSAYKSRYHYQYAIFTSSSFTKPAQEYAFAQDIYLIKLENNKYFHPIIEALGELDYRDFNGSSPDSIEINLTELRTSMRSSLKKRNDNSISGYSTSRGFNREKLCNIVRLDLELGASYLGVLRKNFPIFLTPSRSFDIDHLIQDPTIRICWNNEKWYIVSRHARCWELNESDIIFSFDLPNELFKIYSKNNMLSET
jgi:hypothetical protein